MKVVISLLSIISVASAVGVDYVSNFCSSTKDGINKYAHVNTSTQDIDSNDSIQPVSFTRASTFRNDHQEHMEETTMKKYIKNGAVTGCSYLNKQPKPIINRSTWIDIREKYRRVVGEQQSSIPEEEDDDTDDGFLIPYEVRQCTDGKGRGIFALEDVKNGTVVYRNKFGAIFPNKHTFRQYLSLLSFEHACDVISFAYVMKDDGLDELDEDQHQHQHHNLSEQRSRYVAAFDLDSGSFVNHGCPNTFNIGCLDEKYFCLSQQEIELEQQDLIDYDSNVVALRDIKKDEELLTDYNSFHIDDALPWFDQIWYDAFGDEDEIYPC